VRQPFHGVEGVLLPLQAPIVMQILENLILPDSGLSFAT
jgi:hypothetical protein